jgi:hypothetical protein
MWAHVYSPCGAQMVAVNQALVHCASDKDSQTLRALLVSLQDDGAAPLAGAGTLGGPLVLEA